LRKHLSIVIVGAEKMAAKFGDWMKFADMAQTLNGRGSSRELEFTTSPIGSAVTLEGTSSYVRRDQMLGPIGTSSPFTKGKMCTRS
jgi:hypothetical protein